MSEPEWVLMETVLAIQEQLLSGFGGLGGIRDQGLLDSALNRPKQMFHYGKTDLFELSAAYASSLIRNHPFLDGNKRIGFMTAVVFLEVNGHKFQANEADATIRTLGLASRDVSEKEYGAWLKANSTKVAIL
jgi:death on curing protein